MNSHEVEIKKPEPSKIQAEILILSLKLIEFKAKAKSCFPVNLAEFKPTDKAINFLFDLRDTIKNGQTFIKKVEGGPALSPDESAELAAYKEHLKDIESTCMNFSSILLSINKLPEEIFYEFIISKIADDQPGILKEFKFVQAETTSSDHRAAYLKKLNEYKQFISRASQNFPSISFKTLELLSKRIKADSIITKQKEWVKEFDDYVHKQVAIFLTMQTGMNRSAKTIQASATTTGLLFAIGLGQDLLNNLTKFEFFILSQSDKNILQSYLLLKDVANTEIKNLNIRINSRQLELSNQLAKIEEEHQKIVADYDGILSSEHKKITDEHKAFLEGIRNDLKNVNEVKIFYGCKKYAEKLTSSIESFHELQKEVNEFKNYYLELPKTMQECINVITNLSFDIVKIKESINLYTETESKLQNITKKLNQFPLKNPGFLHITNLVFALNELLATSGDSIKQFCFTTLNEIQQEVAKFEIDIAEKEKPVGTSTIAHFDKLQEDLSYIKIQLNQMLEQLKKIEIINIMPVKIYQDNIQNLLKRIEFLLINATTRHIRAHSLTRKNSIFKELIQEERNISPLNEIETILNKMGITDKEVDLKSVVQKPRVALVSLSDIQEKLNKIPVAVLSEIDKQRANEVRTRTEWALTKLSSQVAALAITQ